MGYIKKIKVQGTEYELYDLRLDTHAQDNNIHVSIEEKSNWNTVPDDKQGW